MSNVLEEYLVKLGIQFDNEGLKKAKETISDFKGKLEGMISKNVYATAATNFIAVVGTITIEIGKMVDQVAKADMQYQLLAQRMHLSVQAAKAFTLASETLGHNLQEIAWNAELREKYFDLVDQINKLEVPPESRDMLKQVRNIGHEFDRLKLAGKLSLEWIAIHLMNLNKGGVAELQSRLRSFTETIFNKIPIWTEQLAEFLQIPIQLAQTVIRFFGDIKDAAVPVLSLIWDLLVKIWDGFAPAHKQLIIIAGLLIAAFSPVLGPIAAATAALTAFFLLLEDFYAYADGRKSSELLEPFWEFVEFLEGTLKRGILRTIVVLDHFWSALKREKHPSGKSWRQDLEDTTKEFDDEWFAKKAERDSKRSAAKKAHDEAHKSKTAVPKIAVSAAGVVELPSSPAPSEPPRSLTTTVTSPEKELLNILARGEGTSDETAKQKGYASGYDVTLGYGKYAKSSKPISRMTFAELEEHQNQMLNEQTRQGIAADKRSSAAGKYQFTKTTLFGTKDKKGLLAQLGISKDTVFTPELQDKLALALIDKATQDFKKGKLSQSGYQNVLAGRWASVAKSGTRVSAYGQRVGTTGADLAAVLPSIKGVAPSPPGSPLYAKNDAGSIQENYNVNVTINAQTTDPKQIADEATKGMKKSVQELREQHRNKVLKQRTTVS